MTYALQVIEAYKTFFEADDEQQRPWWRIWQKQPRRLVTAVDHVSFSVKRGDIYGILGPNGSGKSTLIRLISTLLIPDAGQVLVFVQDVQTNLMAVRRRINRVSVEVPRQPAAPLFQRLLPGDRPPWMVAADRKAESGHLRP